jgi:hypothetical protein
VAKLIYTVLILVRNIAVKRHRAYTFLTHTFSPTEKRLETAMKQVAPRISGETTMWKVWIGMHVGFGALRPDLWLPGAVPMGGAAAVVFFDWPRIAVAGWVHLVGAHFYRRAQSRARTDY